MPQRGPPAEDRCRVAWRNCPLLFVGDEVFGNVDLPKDPHEKARLVVRLFLDGYRGLIRDGADAVPEVVDS